MNLQRIIAKLILWKYKQQYKLNKWLRSVAFIKRTLVWFTLFRADVQLKYAIMEADKKHSVNNRRYYVIPNLAHRLITHDRAQYIYIDKSIKKSSPYPQKGTERGFFQSRGNCQLPIVNCQF